VGVSIPTPCQVFWFYVLLLAAAACLSLSFTYITKQWKSPHREQASIVSFIPGIWTIDSGITVAALAEES